jgi:hypothetical protein
VAAASLVVAVGTGVSLTPSGRASENVVAAPTPVTLSVQPTIIRDLRQPMTIRGSASPAGDGEKVTVQFKACGLLPLQFRDAFETTTERGGGFSVDVYPWLAPGVSGVFRAVHRDSVSAQVPVWHQAPVSLRILGRGRFQAAVTGRVSFWRRHIVLQRQRRGAWVNMRRLVLGDQGYSGPSSSVTVLTAPFRPAVPRGTRIRVVFPRSQAQPCYLAGVSEVRRT